MGNRVDIGHLMLGVETFIDFGGLHHRNQMFAGPAFAAAGQRHAVPHFEQAGHVLGPLHIA